MLPAKMLRFTVLVLACAFGLFQATLLAQAPAPPTTRRSAPAPLRVTSGGLKPPIEKELIYVALPGTLEGSWDQNGSGIVVLDVTTNYSFVKRIPTWFVPASGWPMQVAGVTACPQTNMIYIAARGKLGAWDLSTEKMAWENAFDGSCCERPQPAPDGSFIYVGTDLKDYWYVVDPKTGDLITTVKSPLSPNAHNLNLSADGKTAFMSPNGKVMGIADTTTHTLTKTIPFPDNVRVFVLNHDSSLIYTNQNNLLGFLVVDVKSGEILHKVEVKGFGWPDNWNSPTRPRIPHNCPSHGIALLNDEKEVWLCDGINNCIHIFDNTVMPPKQIDSIKTPGGPYWLTPSIDGQRVYCSSSDVIDVKSRKVIAQLKDEFGRPMHSEKFLDMLFVNGKLKEVSNQFGNGMVMPTAAVAAPKD
jgi:hypothetical protein